MRYRDGVEKKTRLNHLVEFNKKRENGLGVVAIFMLCLRFVYKKYYIDESK